MKRRPSTPAAAGASSSTNRAMDTPHQTVAPVAPSNAPPSQETQRSNSPDPATMLTSPTAPASDPPVAALHVDAAATAVATPSPTSISPSTQNPTTSKPNTPAHFPTGTLLAADTTVEADHTDGESDEPLLPMLSTRSGISEDRARDLFAKYGLQYEARKRAHQEPPTKIRRVEKPVRLRVHWTCHECSRQFGIEKTCAGCGHRRCRECARHPPKRVREMMDTSRRAMEQEQQAAAVQEEAATVAAMAGTETTLPTAVDEDLQRYREEPAATAETAPTAEQPDPKDSSRTQAPPVTGNLLGQAPLELDENADNNDNDPDPETDIPLREVEFSMYTRPRAAMRTMIKPRTHIHGSRKVFTSQFDDQMDHPPMVQAVQRVYRKPRQRVRYTCEHCETLFIDSDRCVECGHERCQSCLREPYAFIPHIIMIIEGYANM